MKKLHLLSIFLIVVLALSMVSCSSGNRIGGTSKNCGCGLKKGMVGY